MVLELRYVSPGGRVWPLMGEDDDRGVYIKEGEIPSLWPTRDETVVRAAGLSGQRLAAHQSGFSPLGVDFTVVVDGGRVGRPLGEVWAEWLSDWSATTPGALISQTNGGEERRFEARLKADFSPEMPDEQFEELGFVELPMSAICDNGVGFIQRDFTGDATVSNDGVDFVWPRVVWSKPGTVTYQSGVTLSLPEVAGVRVVDFDPWAGGEVTDLSGVRDDEAWHQLRGSVFEGIPVGETRRFVLPEGARLIAKIPVKGWS